MLTIRLSRTGKKHKPQYRIVVQQKHTDPWSPALEIIGHYNPHTSPSTIEIKKDRAEHWLSKGAQPSESVHNMLVNAGIMKADKAKAVTISKKRAGKLEEKRAEAEAKKKEAEEKAKAEAEAKAAEEAAAKEAAEAEKKAAEEAAKAEEPKEEAPAEETPVEEPAKEEAPAAEEKTEEASE